MATGRRSSGGARAGSSHHRGDPSSGPRREEFLRGQSYVSLTTDLDGQRVLEVLTGATPKPAGELWEAPPEEQRLKVEGRRGTWARRSSSHPTGRTAGRHRPRPFPCAQAAQAHPFPLAARPPDEQKERFEELLETNRRTAKAWVYPYKEQMVEFWQQPDAEAGNAFFQLWYRSVMRSRLIKMKKVAKTLKSHLSGPLTYFRHRTTNAITGGFNSKIRAIKADARGFRRFENYRTRILFFSSSAAGSTWLPASIHLSATRFREVPGKAGSVRSC